MAYGSVNGGGGALFAYWLGRCMAIYLSSVRSPAFGWMLQKTIFLFPQSPQTRADTSSHPQPAHLPPYTAAGSEGGCNCQQRRSSQDGAEAIRRSRCYPGLTQDSARYYKGEVRIKRKGEKRGWRFRRQRPEDSPLRIPGRKGDREPRSSATYNVKTRAGFSVRTKGLKSAQIRSILLQSSIFGIKEFTLRISEGSLKSSHIERSRACYASTQRSFKGFDRFDSTGSIGPFDHASTNPLMRAVELCSVLGARLRPDWAQSVRPWPAVATLWDFPLSDGMGPANACKLTGSAPGRTRPDPAG